MGEFQPTPRDKIMAVAYDCWFNVWLYFRSNLVNYVPINLDIPVFDCSLRLRSAVEETLLN
jgi:hypothetical protein